MCSLLKSPFILQYKFISVKVKEKSRENLNALQSLKKIDLT